MVGSRWRELCSRMAQHVSSILKEKRKDNVLRSKHCIELLMDFVDTFSFCRQAPKMAVQHIIFNSSYVRRHYHRVILAYLQLLATFC